MSSSTAKLLIVDDNVRNRDILSRQLLRSGFNAETAEDGHTALAMLKDGDFDLLLLDLMMPEIDGMEVLRQVRKDKVLKEMPVIMISASDRSEDMVEAFKTGANDYVLKPIDFPVVLARIKMQLAQLESARQKQSSLPGQAPQETLEDTPQSTPQETPVETPVETPDETSGETPHETIDETGDGVVNDARPAQDMEQVKAETGQDNNPDAKTVIIGAQTPFVSTIDADDELPAGTRFGNYELVNTLGKGAMGVVYEAKNRLLDEHVALKVLPSSIQVDRKAVTRFQLEARSAAKVEHPNVVPIYDVGHWSNIHFIAMQLVRGTNAAELIATQGAMDWKEATRIIADVLRGLVAAHDRGLIHRDIKPANILLDESGAVKISDFGLAKLLMAATDETSLTQSGGMMGTPLYMSPEQVMDDPLDARTDIYSVGGTYYACLTGQSPFPGKGIDVLWAHCNKPVPDPRLIVSQLPDECGHITMRAMAKASDDRYQSAQEMLDQVELLLTQ